MNGARALSEFERLLVAHRSIAAADAAWADYRQKVLPVELEAKVEAKMAQSFIAGYDAAMAAARNTLLTMQNTVLREG